MVVHRAKALDGLDWSTPWPYVIILGILLSIVGCVIFAYCRRRCEEDTSDATRVTNVLSESARQGAYVPMDEEGIGRGVDLQDQSKLQKDEAML